MTLPSQTGGAEPTDWQYDKPTTDFASHPASPAVTCNPKITEPCHCGAMLTDQRCTRCGLPICDLTVRECAWHYCPDPEPRPPYPLPYPQSEPSPSRKEQL